MLEAWTLKRILWSLRKAQLPIGLKDLVLDVGSGGSPHPASDVLLDKYIDPVHRHSPLVIDRPLVLADACKMPFRDKTFDFVIAFHILEHMENPALFLRELQRVGKAGYIETPNAIFERLVPYDVHLLEIMNLDNTLLINKKKAAKPDYFLNELNLIANSPAWNRFFFGNPDYFHVRYFWKDEIKFNIMNPEVACDWFIEPEMRQLADGEITTKAPIESLRSMGLSMLRKWYKLRKRRKPNLTDLLVCPECHGNLIIDKAFISCHNCGISYPNQPLPDFNNKHFTTKQQACN